MNRDHMKEIVVGLLHRHVNEPLYSTGYELDVQAIAEHVLGALRPDDRMVVVSVESPYRPPEQFLGTFQWMEILSRNVEYARALYRYALTKGYAPFASHLNYAQPGVLDDEDEEERWWGINAGKAVERAAAEESWFGVDYGMSKGMEFGEKDAKKNGRPVRLIELGPGWRDKWLGPTKDRPI